VKAVFTPVTQVCDPIASWQALQRGTSEVDPRFLRNIQPGRVRSRPGGVLPPPPGACSHGPRRRRAGQGRPARVGLARDREAPLTRPSERRGNCRLAATTAGPRTGAGSRPRRPEGEAVRTPVSCPGEAGQRTASADRVWAPARVAGACRYRSCRLVRCCCRSPSSAVAAGAGWLSGRWLSRLTESAPAARW
jgi:hypothetical protein